MSERSGKQASKRPRSAKAPAAPQSTSERRRAPALRLARRAGAAHDVATSDVQQLVQRLARSTPMEIVELERQGVRGSFIKDLSREMDIPASRMFGILGVPKATAEKKAASGERVSGSGGQAALGLARLIGIAHRIVASSTAPEARDFDAAKWLGQWIERPQPALAGRRPADLIDTPTGLAVVARLLGSIESGAYQ